jgi:hypothetical protein
MPRLNLQELTDCERADLAALSRKELEELAWRFHELARSLANRLGEDSTNSSRPPSSDDPYRRDQRGEQASSDPERNNGDGDKDGGAGAEAAGKGKQQNVCKPPGKRPGDSGSLAPPADCGDRDR